MWGVGVITSSVPQYLCHCITEVTCLHFSVTVVPMDQTTAFRGVLLQGRSMTDGSVLGTFTDNDVNTRLSSCSTAEVSLFIGESALSYCYLGDENGREVSARNPVMV